MKVWERSVPVHPVLLSTELNLFSPWAVWMGGSCHNAEETLVRLWCCCFKHSADVFNLEHVVSFGWTDRLLPSTADPLLYFQYFSYQNIGLMPEAARALLTLAKWNYFIMNRLYCIHITLPIRSFYTEFTTLIKNNKSVCITLQQRSLLQMLKLTKHWMHLTVSNK